MMERSKVLNTLIKNITEDKTDFIQLESELSVKELELALRAEGFFTAELDRAPIFNKETLMHALYQACRLPAYFGFNWDALEDSLNDFSWIVADAYVLIIRDFELLKERAPEIAKTFRELIHDVAKTRQAAKKKPLCVLLLSSSML
jgi:hypothetical protein